jgi:MFS family permease
MALMVGGCALVALADLVPPSARVPWLIANCVILYLGLALFFVNGAPFIMELVEESQRSAIFGAQTAVLALAAFAGSLVGGFLPQALSAPLGVSPDHPAAFRAALLVGALALAPAVATVLAARPRRDTAPEPAAASAAGASVHPAAAVAVVLAVMGLVRLFQVAGIASTSAFFNVYLDAELDVPTAQIGLIVAIGRLLGAPAALATPLLTARFGDRSTVFWSSLATALAMLPLALLPHWSAAGLTFVGVVGLSSIRYASSMVYFMALVPPGRRGAVAGVTEMAAGISFTAMTFGGGYLIALVGYRGLFLLGAALTGLGALVFALAFRARR